MAEKLPNTIAKIKIITSEVEKLKLPEVVNVVHTKL